MYAGYTIITALIPVGDSPNAIMRRATDILLHDPDVVAYYGTIKTYGLDPGGRAEGRRYFVPEYKYEDNITGECRPSRDGSGSKRRDRRKRRGIAAVGTLGLPTTNHSLHTCFLLTPRPPFSLLQATSTTV